MLLECTELRAENGICPLVGYLPVSCDKFIPVVEFLNTFIANAALDAHGGENGRQYGIGNGSIPMSNYSMSRRES